MGPLFRSLRVFAVSFLLAITVYAGDKPQPTEAVSTSSPARKLGQRRKVQGIGNFGEVTPTLFRGAQPSHQGLEALAKMGIDIVVDARGNRTDSEGKDVGRLGMQYVAIPWHCPFPNDEVLVRFLKLLRENPKKRVFVHCRLGDDRTGMMVAAYRMAAEGWTADEAMNEMQKFGFSSVHHLICPGLASFEKQFPEHLKNNAAFHGLALSSVEKSQ
jgi:tyrosine-protein phosphatase SIW14